MYIQFHCDKSLGAHLQLNALADLLPNDCFHKEIEHVRVQLASTLEDVTLGMPLWGNFELPSVLVNNTWTGKTTHFLKVKSCTMNISKVYVWS